MPHLVSDSLVDDHSVHAGLVLRRVCARLLARASVRADVRVRAGARALVHSRVCVCVCLYVCLGGYACSIGVLLACFLQVEAP